MTEPSMCSGDAALCQITLTTCLVKDACLFLVVVVALWNSAGHYIFILSFVLLSFFLLFPSPNLSRGRVDVCHTCTHGVALVRI